MMVALKLNWNYWRFTPKINSALVLHKVGEGGKNAIKNYQNYIYILHYIGNGFAQLLKVGTQFEHHSSRLLKTSARG
jgi:hypothetical protein